MFGRTVPDAVLHPYRDLVKPGVRFVQTTIRSIDPGGRRVETDAGSFDADVLVVALGADLDPSATPGLVEAGHEFYTVPGAFALRDTLAGVRRRPGGDRSDVDAVQVPAGAERDGVAHARLPHRAGPAGRFGDLPRHAAPRSHPALAGRIGGAPRRLRRARHPLVSRPGGAPTRSCPQRRPVRRRRRDAVRPVPRRAGAPGSRGGCRLGPVCRRMDPGEPAHAGDGLPRRLRRRRCHQRRHTQSGRVRRGPGGGGGLRHHRPAGGAGSVRPVRRAGPVLPGVRPRPGGGGRGDVHGRAATDRHIRTAVQRAGRPEGGLRLEPDPTLVRDDDLRLSGPLRPGVGSHSLSRRTGGRRRTRCASGGWDRPSPPSRRTAANGHRMPPRRGHVRQTGSG